MKSDTKHCWASTTAHHHLITISGRNFLSYQVPVFPLNPWFRPSQVHSYFAFFLRPSYKELDDTVLWNISIDTFTYNNCDDYLGDTNRRSAKRQREKNGKWKISRYNSKPKQANPKQGAKVQCTVSLTFLRKHWDSEVAGDIRPPSLVTRRLKCATLITASFRVGAGETSRWRPKLSSKEPQNLQSAGNKASGLSSNHRGHRRELLYLHKLADKQVS